MDGLKERTRNFLGSEAARGVATSASPSTRFQIVQGKHLLLALLTVICASALTAGFVSWLLWRGQVKNLVREGKAPVITKVEKITVKIDEKLRYTAAMVVESVTPLYRAQGERFGAALAVTDDGLFLTSFSAESLFSEPFLSKAEQSAPSPLQIARKVPELGLMLLRLEKGAKIFPFAKEEEIKPGQVVGIAVPGDLNGSYRVLLTSVREVKSVAASEKSKLLTREILLNVELEPVWLGAPLFSIDEKIIGLVVKIGDALKVIHAGDLSKIVEDYLEFGDTKLSTELPLLHYKPPRGTKPGGWEVVKLPAGSVWVKAGLRAKDFITAIEQQPADWRTPWWHQLWEKLRRGGQAKLEVWREGEKIIVPLELGERAATTAGS
jgi:S1-C subfamily serine protease